MKKKIGIRKENKGYLSGRMGNLGKTITLTIKSQDLIDEEKGFGIFWRDQRLALGYIDHKGEAIFVEESVFLSELWGKNRESVYTWVEQSLSE